MQVCLAFNGVKKENRKAVVEAFCTFLKDTKLDELFVWRPPVSSLDTAGVDQELLLLRSLETVVADDEGSDDPNE